MINLYVDFGDEISYPAAILKGDILYKNLYVPFGPFSYLFNAMMLKIFSVNIKTYYLIGSINAFLIINLVYILSRNFLDKNISLLITLYIMTNCMFVPHLMNFITPYSYSIVYGMSSCFLSCLLFLNYLKTDKLKYLYSSFAFAGITIICKYEFLIYGLLIFILLFIKEYRTKSYGTYLKSLSAFFFIPIISFLFLFARGLSLNDLYYYFGHLSHLSVSDDLTDLYKGTFYFSWDYFILLVQYFVIFLIILFLIYKSVQFIENHLKNFSIFGYIVLFFVLFLMAYRFNLYFLMYIFCWLPVVTMILFLFKFKNIKENEPLTFFILTSLIISIKTFFFLNLYLYGRYFLPLLLIAFTTLICQQYAPGNNNLKKSFMILLLVLCILRPIISFEKLKDCHHSIKTSYGTIYTEKDDAYIFNETINFFNSKNMKEKTLVTFPPAGLINFLTGTNFISPYKTGTYLVFYKEIKPDYFVIVSNKLRNKTCSGNNAEICSWINLNYRAEKIIQKSDSLILIFKKL